MPRIPLFEQHPRKIGALIGALTAFMLKADGTIYNNESCSSVCMGFNVTFLVLSVIGLSTIGAFAIRPPRVLGQELLEDDERVNMSPMR